MSGLERGSLAAAARTVDARSTRSRQRKVGASEIGVCRRRAGYSHHGTPVSDPEHVSGVAALNGKWIHRGALDTMRRQWGTIIETRLENDVLRGHADGIDLPNDWRVRAGLEPHPLAPEVPEVDDLKTKRDGRQVAHVRNVGPKRSELFQGHLYAGMIRRGEWSTIKRHEHLAALGPVPVEVIRLRYWSRAGEQDDAAQEYLYVQEFDPDIEAEALEWVDQVARSSSPEDLPRDQDGPGLSTACDHCPFLAECWGETGDRSPQSLLIVTDADLARQLAEYDTAREIEREAKARKDLARAILDNTTPAIYTDGEDVAFKLAWSGGKTGDPKPDVDAMLALFADAKIPVPMLEAKPSARTIQLVRWEVPEEECGKPVGDPIPWQEDETSASDWWVQDRARGGWTLYRVRDELTGELSHVQNELTAGKFEKRFPDYVEPRPPCILRKGHSGDCWPADALQELDTASDA